MILTDKQAHTLLIILQDSIKINVAEHLTIGHKDREELMNEILLQQSETLIDLQNLEIKATKIHVVQDEDEIDPDYVSKMSLLRHIRTLHDEYIASAERRRNGGFAKGCDTGCAMSLEKIELWIKKWQPAEPQSKIPEVEES